LDTWLADPPHMPQLQHHQPALSQRIVEDAAAHEPLILVDEANRAVGSAGKLDVHRKGLLHRAFSIFLFDAAGRVLLQRRARTKYHSGGLWANTCCGHPRLGERTSDAARRRLREELGMRERLQYGFRARYATPLDHGLTENELVYVYGGPVEGAMQLNPAEVSETAFIPLEELIGDMRLHPQGYVYWLRHYLERHAREVRALREAVVEPPRSAA
jgi:isopentenyl-diphosphate Delta-isomerase